MSYVASDGAWAQRIQKEQFTSSKLFQKLLSRRNPSIQESNNLLSERFYESQPSFKQNLKIQNHNEQDDIYLLNNQALQGDQREEIYQSELMRLNQTDIGTRLLSLNDRLMSNSNKLFSHSNRRLSQKINKADYSFGGQTNIKNTQYASVFTNDRLNQSVNFDQPLPYSGRNSRIRNSIQNIQNDPQPQQQQNSMRESLSKRRQALQEFASKVRLSNVLSQTDKMSTTRSLKIKGNSDSKEVLNFHSARPVDHEHKFKYRFNEDLGNEITNQRMSQNALAKPLKRKNLDQIEDSEFILNEARSSRCSQKNKRDILGISSTHHRANKSFQNSSHVSVRNSTSKVRNKLIEAIQKMDQEQLQVAQEKINEAKIDSTPYDQIVNNPEEQLINRYFDNLKVDEEAYEMKSAKNEEGRPVNFKMMDQIQPQIDLRQQEEYNPEKQVDMTQPRSSHTLNLSTEVSDKFSHLEQELTKERLLRKKLETNFNKLQDMFYKEVVQRSSEKSKRSLKIRSEKGKSLYSQYKSSHSNRPQQQLQDDVASQSDQQKYGQRQEKSDEFIFNEIGPQFVDTPIISNTEVVFLMQKIQQQAYPGAPGVNQIGEEIQRKTRSYVDKFDVFGQDDTTLKIRSAIQQYIGDIPEIQAIMLWNLTPGSYEEATTLIPALKDAPEEKVRSLIEQKPFINIIKRLQTNTVNQLQPLPSFLSSKPNEVDILYSDSNNILFNLATEEYMYEHLNIINPVLFIWRNTRTIIIGKHQNPWKECRVQLLEDDGVILARRKSGGGCVYQDLGNSVFSFLNPISDFSKEDYKTMNNDILIKSLELHGVKAEATGRNDICVNGKKVSGSAYKLSLGKRDGSGRKSLHHGTMLLDLDLNALQKYLNPNKAKLLSKGVDSVIARVMNLKEQVPNITHETYSEALTNAFKGKWQSKKANEQLLKVSELEKIDKLMELYESYKKWEWRFGETPSFTNAIEKKFDWALMDVEFDVYKGKIIKGKVYSDCLLPTFIDEMNDILEKGQITYDVEGMNDLGRRLVEKFSDNEVVVKKMVPELIEWMKKEI